jgi:uncharacterized protein involved in type VI secretion and phage assembly
MSDVEQALAQGLGRQPAFGKHRGFVTDNADPDKRGRIKLQVPALLGDQATDWALPCLPCGGLAEQGFLFVPDIGAQVWVEFEGGDLSYPIWVGTFWQQSADVPSEVADQATTRLLKTTSGHLLMFEDKQGDEAIKLLHAKGAKLDMDAKGSFAITDKKGATVTLDADKGQITVEDANGNTLTMSGSGTTVEDANGNKVEMAASGITVKGTKIVLDGQQVMLGGAGGEPIIKGQSFLTLFATHIHTCTAPGSPTSPPIPQGEMSSLSLKVMTG